jgi:hypothetical protein
MKSTFKQFLKEDFKRDMMPDTDMVNFWLHETIVGLRDYTINDDLTVDVHEDVQFRRSINVPYFPVNFGVVDGRFIAVDIKLISLIGFPKSVGNTVNINDNRLTSLKHAPREVGGVFTVLNNFLRTLEGGPKEVGGTYYCSRNNLTSLKGAPKEVGGSFFCDENQLVTLEGAPREVGGMFTCNNNQLTDLKGAPDIVGYTFECVNNKFTEEPDHSFIQIADSFSWR